MDLNREQFNEYVTEVLKALQTNTNQTITYETLEKAMIDGKNNLVGCDQCANGWRW